MNKSKIEFVHPKRFSVDLVPPGSTMAVRTNCDEIVVVVRLACCPGDDVMNVDVDMTTRRDRASVASLDENTSAEVGWNLGSIHDQVT